MGTINQIFIANPWDRKSRKTCLILTVGWFSLLYKQMAVPKLPLMRLFLGNVIGVLMFTEIGYASS